MQKGIEDLNATARKEDIEEDTARKWTRIRITWKGDKKKRITPYGGIDPTPSRPPLSPACQAPCPTSKQQTGRGLGCRILATAYEGRVGASSRFSS
jgi:hypothetical protein